MDSSDDIIYKYNSSGTYQETMSLHASSDNPQGLTIDDNGDFWIIDVNDDRAYFISNVISPNNVQSNTGISIDSNYNIYVLNSSFDEIYRYSSSGIYQETIDLHNSNINPQGMAHDSSDNFYVVDTSTDTIFKYNSSHVYQEQINLHANNTSPFGVAIDSNGNIYVVDSTDRDIYVYNSAGTHQSTLDIGGVAASYVGIGIDVTDNIWVIFRTSPPTIRRYSLTGTLLETVTLDSSIQRAEGIAIDKSGYRYVLDGEGLSGALQINVA